MRTLNITLVGMVNDKPAATCGASLNLTTFEIMDVLDKKFHQGEDAFEGYSLCFEGEYYPVAVDHLDTENEFMLMDAEGIDAISDYLSKNPNSIKGQDDFEEDDDDYYSDAEDDIESFSHYDMS